MKIIRKRTYMGMNDQIERLTKQILRQQKELHDLQDELGEVKHSYYERDVECEKLGCDIEDYKKEIKRLKTLLTKNKIDYKKEK